jgi:hypothetical protein
MPNGKPHDHPVTDTVIHGRHPFPPNVEDLVRQVHARNPGVFNDLGWAPFEWEKGNHLAEARVPFGPTRRLLTLAAGMAKIARGPTAGSDSLAAAPSLHCAKPGTSFRASCSVTMV